MKIMSIYDKICNLSKVYSLPNFNYLSHHLPVFPILSKQVKILNEPHDFYNEVLSSASCASQRVTFASLYIGTGKLERQLVNALSKQLERNNGLKVCWLLDYTRASRGSENSRTLLLPLIKDHESSCKVSLFHTPNLRGLTKLILPQRWNEIVGLQHMKIYVFDNSVLLSGANLSHDYFVNRQDRYVLIRDCKELADFYDDLISVVSSHSFRLRGDDTAQMEGNAIHPYLGNYKQYCTNLRSSITEFWASEMSKSRDRLEKLVRSLTRNAPEEGLPDTVLLPTVQIPPSGITLDSEATLNFLRSSPLGSDIHLATGYFNLTNQIAEIVLRESNSGYRILCAHPKANGFLGAKGSAGGIPAAYTNLCKTFYRHVLKTSTEDRIAVYEFQRAGWTFHAKGLWYAPPGETLPSVTLIGSPNFGYRSAHRDLETQLFIATKSAALRQMMGVEVESLYSRGSQVHDSTFRREDRTVPLWVRLVTHFFKYFF